MSFINDLGPDAKITIGSQDDGIVTREKFFNSIEILRGIIRMQLAQTKIAIGYVVVPMAEYEEMVSKAVSNFTNNVEDDIIFRQKDLYYKARFDKNRYLFFCDASDRDPILPREMFENDELMKIKTQGRNEPCLCNSGKKYKHCCI